MTTMNIFLIDRFYDDVGGRREAVGEYPKPSTAVYMVTLITKKGTQVVFLSSFVFQILYSFTLYILYYAAVE